MGVLYLDKLSNIRDRLRPILLGVFCAAQMLDIMNLSAVNIFLPHMRDELGFTESTLQWVVSAYSITFGGLLMLAGKSGDLFGHRIMFLVGVAWLSIWTLVAGLAPSSIVLCIARALQGAGAAFTVPTSMALITITYKDEKKRSSALAFFAAFGSLGFVIGLILGGVLSGTIGWRWFFFISTIFGGILFVVAFLAVPVTLHDIEKEEKEWKISNPLMPLKVWKIRNFAPIFITAALIYGYWQGYMYFATLILQVILRYTPMQTALAFLPLGICGLIFSFLVGKIIPHMNPKILLAVGLAIVTGSAVIFAFVDENTSYWRLPFPSFVLSQLGLAFSYITANTIAVSGANPSDQGLVGGLFNMALQIGGGIGLAILTAIATSINNSSMATTLTGAQLLKGYRVALWCSVGFTSLALIVVLVFVRGIQNTNDDKTNVQNNENRQISSAEKVCQPLPNANSPAFAAFIKKVNEKSKVRGTPKCQNYGATGRLALNQDKHKRGYYMLKGCNKTVHDWNMVAQLGVPVPPKLVTSALAQSLIVRLKVNYAFELPDAQKLLFNPSGASTPAL
ncbi:uncharacterized protein VTP21DRAFT_8839 [Calcarisporiella thermophila]|uniref:uncharacterized protein n=1 Tax=Calcarisporiella thermophila TaxID=911321 RepID=UPI0037442432